MGEDKSPLLWIFAVIVALILGAGGGYWYGNKVGAKAGYDRGLTDAAKIQSGGTQIKVDTGYKNPFEKVNLNPFKK